MKRRHFIKTSATGSALLFTSGAFAFNHSKVQDNKGKYCFQSARDIPVAYNVDLVVVGGSLAAVSAAVEGAKAGAKVFLVAQEPYLGEDICGTFRLWTKDPAVLTTDLGRAVFGNGLPSPMHVKRTLDNALMDHDIDFLYSSYVTDVLTNENGDPAGVVISNRSGREAIVAKTIIDATPRALVARLAGAKFGAYPAGKQIFKFTVVGNDLKQIPGLSAKVHTEPVQSTGVRKELPTTAPFQKLIFVTKPLNTLLGLI